jgi:hypothetical protein
VLNQYLCAQHLEEGRGSWVSPTTFIEYGMNVYKTPTPGGSDKASRAAIEEDLEGKGGVMRAKGLTFTELDALDPELDALDPEVGRIAREMWDELARSP